MGGLTKYHCAKKKQQEIHKTKSIENVVQIPYHTVASVDHPSKFIGKVVEAIAMLKAWLSL